MRRPSPRTALGCMTLGWLVAASSAGGASQGPSDAKSLVWPLINRQLSWSQELEIGPSDSPGKEVLFGHVSSVVTDSRGNIYVADYGFEKVHVFTSEGTWIRSFGQIGEGPGDLPQFFRMAIDAHDRLYFAGIGGFVSVLDTLGRAVDAFRRTNVGNPARSIVVDEKGCVYIVSADILDQTLVQKYGPNHRLLASFGPTFAVGLDVDTRTEQLYAAGSLCLRPDGALVFSQAAPFELRWYSPDGRQIGSFAGYREFVPMPVDPEFRDGGMIARLIPNSISVVCLSDGRVLNSAFDPGDGEGTEESLLSLHDTSLQPVAERRLGGVVYAVGRDSQDRIFLFEPGERIRLLRVRLFQN